MTLADRILLAIVMAAAAFAAGVVVGHRDASATGQAHINQSLQTGIEHHNVTASAGAAVEAHATGRQSQTEATFNGINQEVIRYVQIHAADRACGLDADGVRLWQSANNGADASAPGIADGSVSASAAVAERQPQ